MKCVSEMQFMQYFCYLTVSAVPIYCKILLGDVRGIIVAFTDDKKHCGYYGVDIHHSTVVIM